MMGTSHAASGAAAWLALTATSIPALGIYELTPGTVLLGVGVAARTTMRPSPTRFPSRGASLRVPSERYQEGTARVCTRCSP